MKTLDEDRTALHTESAKVKNKQVNQLSVPRPLNEKCLMNEKVPLSFYKVEHSPNTNFMHVSKSKFARWANNRPVAHLHDETNPIKLIWCESTL